MKHSNPGYHTMTTESLDQSTWKNNGLYHFLFNQTVLKQDKVYKIALYTANEMSQARKKGKKTVDQNLLKIFIYLAQTRI